MWGLCHHHPRGPTPSLSRYPLSKQAHLPQQVPPAPPPTPSTSLSLKILLINPLSSPRPSHVIYVLTPGRHCAALWGLRRCLPLCLRRGWAELSSGACWPGCGWTSSGEGTLQHSPGSEHWFSWAVPLPVRDTRRCLHTFVVVTAAGGCCILHAHPGPRGPQCPRALVEKLDQRHVSSEKGT